MFRLSVIKFRLSVIKFLASSVCTLTKHHYLDEQHCQRDCLVRLASMLNARIVTLNKHCKQWVRRNNNNNNNGRVRATTHQSSWIWRLSFWKRATILIRLCWRWLCSLFWRQMPSWSWIRRLSLADFLVVLEDDRAAATQKSTRTWLFLSEKHTVLSQKIW